AGRSTPGDKEYGKAMDGHSMTSYEHGSRRNSQNRRNLRMSTILFTNPTNLDLAKKCLALIRDVAARGACSEDPGLIGYALQELTQVLLERTGIEDRLFEPVPANNIEGCGGRVGYAAFHRRKASTLTATETAQPS